MDLIYWLQIKAQYGDNTDIRVNFPNGVNLSQINEIERDYTKKADEYGKANAGDYEGFDCQKTIETILNDFGFYWKYPSVGHTIYI